MIVEKRILKEKAPETYRLIVISDVHAHYELFNKLVHQTQLKEDDYLVILGDFMEKGDDGLEVLYKIRDLKQRNHTFVLMGNCEEYLLRLLCDETKATKLIEYIKTSSNSLLSKTAEVLNLDVDKEEAKNVQEKLKHYLDKEISILKSLDTALEFDQFIFVHAGVEKREDWENSDIETMLELRDFFYQGHTIRDKYVICGHTPTCNYYDYKIDNSVILSHQRKIISIDGGVGVKSVSQLNAFIIEKSDEGYVYSSKSVDEYDKCEVVFPHKGKETSAVKVAWPNLEVDVLGIGTSFSWCRKVDTQELLYIKNEFLYEENGHYYCRDDYISSMLEILPYDRVSLIATYGKYAYIMKDGHVGWTKKDKIKKSNN